MDFRISPQQLADKENFGVHQDWQNGELQRVVSILKTSQGTNFPLERKRVCFIDTANFKVITVSFLSPLVSRTQDKKSLTNFAGLVFSQSIICWRRL